MKLESRTRSIRLSEKSSHIIDTIPREKGISKNRFIIECIEAHKEPASRKIKGYHKNQIIQQTNLALLVRSSRWDELPESIKKTIFSLRKDTK